MNILGHLDGDLKWFCTRMKAVAPNSDVPYDIGGEMDEEYVFFDEEHNINYTLIRHSGIFRIETEVTLPPAGGHEFWVQQVSELKCWCRDKKLDVLIESNICPNGQIGMIVLSMGAAEASEDNVGLLRDYMVNNICSDLTAYCDRYVGVRYEETGHWFYAYLRGFDICKAMLVKSCAVEIYDSSYGTERGGAANVSEEMKVCMDMNSIDMLEPQNLISEEVFRREWGRRVLVADNPGCN